MPSIQIVFLPRSKCYFSSFSTVGHNYLPTQHPSLCEHKMTIVATIMCITLDLDTFMKMAIISGILEVSLFFFLLAIVRCIALDLDIVKLLIDTP